MVGPGARDGPGPSGAPPGSRVPPGPPAGACRGPPGGAPEDENKNNPLVMKPRLNENQISNPKRVSHIGVSL